MVCQDGWQTWGRPPLSLATLHSAMSLYGGVLTSGTCIVLSTTAWRHYAASNSTFVGLVVQTSCWPALGANCR